MIDWVQIHSLAIIVTVLASFSVIAMAETLWPARESSAPLAPRWGASGTLYFFNLFLSVLIPASTLGTAYLAQSMGIGLFNWTTLPAVVTIILAFVLLDLSQYLLHRLQHRLPLLWRLHQVHHTDDDYDITTGLRFHPIESVLTIIFRLSVVFILGAPLAAVVIYEVWATAAGFYGHANVRLPVNLEQLLRKVFVTPTMHCIHHSTEADEVDSNFSAIFSGWDRWLGTYTAEPRLGQQGLTFGLTDVSEPHRLKTLFLMPFRLQK
jgi:sterol desaturase/sphingolipid hydroxylase (fatty acid hydroxylase superfamily)